MVARSRRKSSPATKDASIAAPKDVSSSRAARSREKPAKIDDPAGDDEKENKARSTRAKPKAKTAHDGKIKEHTGYCLCHQPDDGSPMVCCSLCNEWYHFRCVGLGLEEASELEVYVCPTCTAKTGRRSIMQWENPVVHQDVPDTGSSKSIDEQRPPTPPPALLPSESEEDQDSEDEYVAEPDKVKGKGSSRHRARRLSGSSDSDEGSDGRGGQAPSRRSAVSDRKASPATGSHLKRKSTTASHTPAAKRKKAADAPTTVEDDPARKYCLGKLQEMFFPIFLRYPHADAPNGSGNKVELPPDNLSDEDKQRLENEARVFASELEQCVFDIYAEPDKHGKPSVGSKYKERFRTLTFNLSQTDRVAIHTRICFATISAKEIAVMSSTDLANEETKQSIRIAEQESLEHSILQKATAPRAKITHKGLQDIEDVNGETATLQREREKEREKEEEERRERERQARLRAAEQHQKQRSDSISQSVPPESPIVAQTPTWGAPPSTPLAAMSIDGYSPTVGVNDRSLTHPLFTSSISEYQPSIPEPELDIGDLIHLDDEPPPQDATVNEPSSPTLEGPVTTTGPVLSSSAEPSGLPAIATSEVQTASADVSSQATKPETPIKPTFDLNALWSAPKRESPPREIQEAPVLEFKDRPMEVDAVPQEATDQDFDMFLEKDQDGEVDVPHHPIQDPEAVFKAIPPVWHGTIALPLDTPIAEEAHVVARQIGGRNLGEDSPLWKTLFTTNALRIEGRVQTEKAAQFLLQMRLNPQKELIACAFLPEPGDVKLQTFIDFLLKKDRHGLVFPWGQHPKEYHPGRELYMVPLSANAPLPDYLELLDELHLPKARISDILVGIWILMKGKLTPLPPPPPVSVAAPLPLAPAPTSGPSAGLSVPLHPPAQHPPTSSSPDFRAFPQLANSALAAEVAALTPEQIQAVLQALSSGNGTSGVPVPIGAATALGNTTNPPQPSHVPLIPPPSSATPQQWNGGIPNFPPYPPNPPNPIPVSAFGSQPPPPPPAMPSPVRQPPSGPSSRGAPRQGHYDKHDGDRDFRRGGGGSGYDRGGNDRGNWQNGRARGRARGWGRGGGSYRAVDSGWGRGRGSSGQDEGQSGSNRQRRW